MLLNKMEELKKFKKYTCKVNKRNKSLDIIEHTFYGSINPGKNTVKILYKKLYNEKTVIQNKEYNKEDFNDKDKITKLKQIALYHYNTQPFVIDKTLQRFLVRVKELNKIPETFAVDALDPIEATNNLILMRSFDCDTTFDVISERPI